MYHRLNFQITQNQNMPAQAMPYQVVGPPMFYQNHATHCQCEECMQLLCQASMIRPQFGYSHPVYLPQPSAQMTIINPDPSKQLRHQSLSNFMPQAPFSFFPPRSLACPQLAQFRPIQHLTAPQAALPPYMNRVISNHPQPSQLPPQQQQVIIR